MARFFASINNASGIEYLEGTLHFLLLSENNLKKTSKEDKVREEQLRNAGNTEESAKRARMAIQAILVLTFNKIYGKLGKSDQERTWGTE